MQVKSNLVLVRVVVRDKKGNPIRGLKKEDFHLIDQGKEQTISQFEEVSPDESASFTAASSTPTATSPRAGLAERYIAFYFDDLNSSAADLIQARDAADRYLTTSLQPNDRVAIFTAEKMLSDFTSDSRRIHEALTQLHASTRSPANEHLCPDLSDYQAYEILHTNDLSSDAWMTALAEAAACPVKIVNVPSNLDPSKLSLASMEPIRMLAERILGEAQSLTRANLQQFETVVNAIASAPGERMVVLVSPGFLSQSEQYTLDRIVDRALRAQIVIDSLDPKGLAILLRESDASRNTIVLPDARASQARNHLDASKEFVRADVLAEFAQGTGGEFFRRDNDLKAGFAALTQDPPHYILAFSPQKVKWDGKFHALKVSFTTKEKGRTIQARRGYFAVESNPTSDQQVSTANTAPTSSTAAEPSNQAATLASSNAASTTAAGEPQPVAPETHASSLGPPSSAIADDNRAENPATPRDLATLRPNTTPPHLRRGRNRVTVDQLEQFLAAVRGKPDAGIAKRLMNFELTERLDSAKLGRLDADLGNQSRQVLIALADTAAFLKPPATDVALPATPSQADQLQWLKAATQSVTTTLSKLPNFFATRDVTRFADSPARQVMGAFFSYQPLHSIDRLQATVLYRHGKQELDSDQHKSTSNAAGIGLVTEGEFGPILGTVLMDASTTSLTWSRWDPGPAGPLAVYYFAVPRNKSHYEVQYCCVTEGSAIGLFKQVSAYHGEVAIDPATGSIMRIAIQADLKDSFPLTRADLAVEYGQVEIGGKNYICPLRSVAIVQAYAKAPDMALDEPLLLGKAALAADSRELPVRTMINDIAFVQYHLFRSDSRILPASD